ncbi:MAG: hypothetical protein LBS49_02425, partial [Candidatus Accumulibacter sp.]|nr:hypothetical protein [Accumulibacter sp.]
MALSVSACPPADGASSIQRACITNGLGKLCGDACTRSASAATAPCAASTSASTKACAGTEISAATTGA